MKLGIINTSTSCTDYLDHKYDIRTARMRVIMEGKEYIDFIELTAPDFFSKIRNNHDITPTTSTPNVVDFQNLMEELENEGCTDILVLTISSGMSNAYSIAYSAANDYEGKANVKVFDTHTAAIQEGMFSLEACKLRDEGKSIDEVLERLHFLRDNNKILFVVDSLRQLIKNGRLSGAAGFVGNILKIKPFLHVNNEGVIENLDKVRTSKKALKAMVDYFVETVKDKEDFTITLITSDYAEGEEYVKAEVMKHYPDHTYVTSSLTPVVGCHTAEGVVGLGYFLN